MTDRTDISVSLNPQTRTFRQLRQHAQTVAYNLKLFRNLQLCNIAISIIVFILQFPFSAFFNRVFAQTASANDPLYFLQSVIEILAGGMNLVKPEGGFDHLLFSLGSLRYLMIWGMIAYVFHILYRSFDVLKSETSPFTQENARSWKRVARICGIFGVLSFFICGLISMIVVELFSSAFYIISLLFEYGSELQKESDETI